MAPAAALHESLRSAVGSERRVPTLPGFERPQQRQAACTAGAVTLYRRSPVRVDDPPAAMHAAPTRWLLLAVGAVLATATGLVLALLIGVAASGPSTGLWIGVGLGALLVACGIDIMVRALRPDSPLFEGNLGLIRAGVLGVFLAVLVVGSAAAAVARKDVEAALVCVQATLAALWCVRVIVRRMRPSPDHPGAA